MGLAGLLFVFMGVNTLISSNTFGIVYIVFGMISMLFVRTDLKNYRGKAAHRNYWLLAHLQRMTGGYIAALTAFLVVNADNFPSVIPGVVLWSADGCIDPVDYHLVQKIRSSVCERVRGVRE